MEWKPDPAMFANDSEMAKATEGGMLALYEGWWRDFGELLVDIEQRGIHVDEVRLPRHENSPSISSFPT